jgi:hypothetical protein
LVAPPNLKRLSWPHPERERHTGVSQHVRVDFEVDAQGIAKRVDASRRQGDHEVDIVGGAWLALE